MIVIKRNPSPFEHVHLLGRWEFTGHSAPDVVRQRYVGKSVAGLWKQGAANPVTYVNC